MSNNIEILAPAGAFESVKAAACTGASAVYIGAQRFSARASATNFDEDEIIKAVRYIPEDMSDRFYRYAFKRCFRF